MDKTCTKCKVTKLSSEFYKDKRKKDGLRSWCKTCQREDNNSRESKYNETRKLYRENHKEEYRENKRKYYKENKERILQVNAEWRQSLNGRLLSYKSAAKKRNLNWQLSDEEFESYWGKNCHYCNDKIKGVGIDRLDSNKGYTIENTVPSCTTCNIMKSNHSVSTFLEQIEKIWEHSQKLRETSLN